MTLLLHITRRNSSHPWRPRFLYRRPGPARSAHRAWLTVGESRLIPVALE